MEWLVALITGTISVGGILLSQLIQNKNFSKNQKIIAEIQNRRDLNKSKELAFNLLISTIHGYENSIGEFIRLIQKWEDLNDSVNCNGHLYLNPNDAFLKMVDSKMMNVRNAFSSLLLYLTEDTYDYANDLYIISIELFNLCIAITNNDHVVTEKHIKVYNAKSKEFSSAMDYALAVFQSDISNI